MNMNVASATPTASGSPGFGGAVGFKVDLSRGERVGRVSSEWFSRPDDERFLSLPELYAAVRARAERATARTLESPPIRVEARRETFWKARVGKMIHSYGAPIDDADARAIVEYLPGTC
jgi:hypothetical protein